MICLLDKNNLIILYGKSLDFVCLTKIGRCPLLQRFLVNLKDIVVSPHSTINDNFSLYNSFHAG